MMYSSQFEHLNSNFVNGQHQRNIYITSNNEMDNQNVNCCSQQQRSISSSTPAVVNDSCANIKSVAPKDKKRLRTVFTGNQFVVLEKEFAKSKYVKLTRRIELANELSLKQATIRIWFQNRRMKLKKDIKLAKEEIHKLNKMKLSDTASVLLKSEDFYSGKCVKTRAPSQYDGNSYESYAINYDNNNRIPYNNQYDLNNTNNNYVAPIDLTTTYPEAQAGQYIYSVPLNHNDPMNGVSCYDVLNDSKNYILNNEMQWLYPFIPTGSELNN